VVGTGKTPKDKGVEGGKSPRPRHMGSHAMHKAFNSPNGSRHGSSGEKGFLAEIRVSLTDRSRRRVTRRQTIAWARQRIHLSLRSRVRKRWEGVQVSRRGFHLPGSEKGGQIFLGKGPWGNCDSGSGRSKNYVKKKHQPVGNH